MTIRYEARRESLTVQPHYVVCARTGEQSKFDDYAAAKAALSVTPEGEMFVVNRFGGRSFVAHNRRWF